MKSVSVRELRAKGHEILERVAHGKLIVVTRDGRAVAELRPLPRQSPGPAELIARRKHLPPLDPTALRRDIDAVVDSSQ